MLSMTRDKLKGLPGDAKESIVMEQGKPSNPISVHESVCIDQPTDNDPIFDKVWQFFYPLCEKADTPHKATGELTLLPSPKDNPSFVGQVWLLPKFDHSYASLVGERQLRKRPFLVAIWRHPHYEHYFLLGTVSDTIPEIVDGGLALGSDNPYPPSDWVVSLTLEKMEVKVGGVKNTIVIMDKDIGGETWTESTRPCLQDALSEEITRLKECAETFLRFPKLHNMRLGIPEYHTGIGAWVRQPYSNKMEWVRNKDAHDKAEAGRAPY